MNEQPKRGRFEAHPAPAHPHGFQISYESGSGRKTYDLPSRSVAGESAPLAVESFALEPEYYAQLLDRVEAHLTGRDGERPE